MRVPVINFITGVFSLFKIHKKLMLIYCCNLSYSKALKNVNSGLGDDSPVLNHPRVFLNLKQGFE